MTPRNRRIVVISLALSFFAIVVSGLIAVVASEAAPDVSTPNVMLTMTVGEMEGDRPVPGKFYRLIAVPRQTPTTLFVGSRVPIPATVFNTSQTVGGNVVPVTSFSYQNVGFNAEVRVRYVERGTIRIDASIENSSIGGEFDQRPSVTTTEQEISVSLKDGVPLEIARAGSSYLSIRADVLD